MDRQTTIGVCAKSGFFSGLRMHVGNDLKTSARLIHIESLCKHERVRKHTEVIRHLGVDGGRADPWN
jgi:hypothetical protein